MLTWQEFENYAAELKMPREYIEENKEFFFKLDPDYFDKMLLMENPPEAEIKALFPNEEYRRLLFILLVAKYPQMEKIYRERNYETKHLEEIKEDITLWLKKSSLDTDGRVAGIDYRIYGWESLAFSGELLQFGRLQCNRRHNFECKVGCFRNSDNSIRIEKVDGHSAEAIFSYGDEAINIHIPASGPLTRELCINSLKQMVEFFDKEKFDYKAVVCYSWILDPTFAEILPKSNLIQFQQLGHTFRMEGCDQTSEVIWRVFDIIDGTAADLDKRPHNSSMQKAIANYLKQGGEFCEYGLIILKDELVELLK